MRIKGKWEPLISDNDLQKRFNQILQNAMLKKGIQYSNVLLGSSFLNRYQNILN